PSRRAARADDPTHRPEPPRRLPIGCAPVAPASRALPSPRSVRLDRSPAGHPATRSAFLLGARVSGTGPRRRLTRNRCLLFPPPPAPRRRPEEDPGGSRAETPGDPRGVPPLLLGRARAHGRHVRPSTEP